MKGAKAAPVLAFQAVEEFPEGTLVFKNGMLGFEN
jgi:hypothetical protein